MDQQKEVLFTVGGMHCGIVTVLMRAFCRHE